MVDFTINNPTTLHFGINVINNLGKTILSFGKKVLLIYGKGSIKTNGIYDEILEVLKAIKAEILEFEGIKANPIIEDVNKAATLARSFNPDIILAVGGGSVIDSAKLISITIPVDHSGWLFMNGSKKPTKAIPLIAVLTLAATGTEMNPFAVVQNNLEKEKLGLKHSLIYPVHSFLNPSYTVSVNEDYTAFGIVDVMAHALENYFGKGDAPLSDKFIFSILNEVVEVGPLLMNNLYNIDLRARILYASTNALNGLTTYGREYGDWGVHAMGHHLSLLFDVPHGASLSVIYPAWLQHMSSKIEERVVLLGKSVFGVSSLEKTIIALNNFFLLIGAPVKMKSLGLSIEQKEIALNLMIEKKIGGMHHQLTPDDLSAIMNNAFE